MRGRRTIALGLTLAAVSGSGSGGHPAAATPSTRPAAAAAAVDAPAVEAAWSESLNGLRVRLTAPGGPACREGSPTPLLVEVRNVSEQPIANRSLWTTVRILAVDADGKWLGVAWMGPEVGEWAVTPGDLGPGQVTRLQLAFESLRFNRPLKAGETVELRASAPTQQQRRGQLPLEVNSPPLAIRVEAPFPRALVEADVAADWRADLACRVDVGLRGSRTVRVNAQGNAALVLQTQRDGVRVEGRWSVALPPERLARLAADLRAAGVLRLDEARSGPAVPDGASIRLALVGRSGGSVVGEFAGPAPDEPPTVRAVRLVAEGLMAELEAQAATRPAQSR